ncbi:MAG TPA: hypothetical protein VGO18_39405, partial [Steroidobacteraceae bacterium]|nr:hypothetical protein [Steroidobacteraceae bacterium]
MRAWVGIGVLAVLGSVGVFNVAATAAQPADSRAIADGSGMWGAGFAPGSGLRVAAAAANDVAAPPAPDIRTRVAAVTAND